MGLFTTLNSILAGEHWPPPQTARIWEEIELFQAFRNSDDTRIRQEAQKAFNVPYILSPVPRLVSRASANLLFAAAPIFRADNDTDQANVDRIVTENDLTAELHRGALISSSEGEVWGRLMVRPELLDVPIIEFVSRGRVIPEFQGRFVTGATFITTYHESDRQVYRLFESYYPGQIVSRLYLGTRGLLGTEMPLTAHPATQSLQRVIETGFNYPLCCYIPNSVDGDPTRGYSDYVGLRDRFLALNEASTIGQANLRVAGRKRAMIDAGYMKQGQLPTEDDVYVRTSRHAGDDTRTASPLQVIDYNYQAQETVRWVDWMIDTTLQFAGVAPQLLGRNVDGSVISGTALKLKMAHSLMESAGKGHYFDRQVPRLLGMAMQLDSARGHGFGRTYETPESPVSMQRVNGIPRDDTEAASQLSLWSASLAISTEQKVAFLHPEWTPAQQADEVSKLKSEQQAAQAAGAQFAAKPGRLAGDNPGEQH